MTIGYLGLVSLLLIFISPVFVIVSIVVALGLIVPAVRKQTRRQMAVQEWERRVYAARERYQWEVASWWNAVALHNRAEQQRVASTMVWSPLRLQMSTDRVDVFGGVPFGWRHLVTVFGATVVARRTPLMVLDFTEEAISSGLTELAQQAFRTRIFELPRDNDHIDLMAGLTPDEVAEILADAAESMRTAADPISRATDADILRVVAGCLQGTMTSARLAAGLRVLQRTYQGGNVLTLDELSSLTRHIDALGTGERLLDQLRFLRSVLELLVSHTGASTLAAPVDEVWRSHQLTVLATNSSHAARKDITDRILFLSVLQRLRGRDPALRGLFLLVAGADHMGAPALEALARQARSCGVRLVYMFEHLRDGADRLLGTGNSASLIMRLGNAAEAATAAEYIGRGYSLKLSQITRQLGATETTGGGDSTGRTRSDSWSKQANSGSGGVSSGHSYSHSVSDSFQKMSNWSASLSNTTGTTHQRVYEFDVEPQTIQSLPLTAFVLVEGGPQGRRTAVADCNPAIAMLERCANHPIQARRP